jgi:hypothetical protein
MLRLTALLTLACAACGHGGATPVDGRANDAPLRTDATTADATPIDGPTTDAAIDPTCGVLAFATTPTRVPLPTGFAPQWFKQIDQVGNACYPGSNRPGYGFVDLDGDRRPELVVTSACADATVGTDHWQVNHGGPLASYALPPGYPAAAFPAIAAYAACGPGGQPVGYDLLDLVGDGHLDLVVTSDCGDAAVGATRWDVFAGGATGFAATPVAYALPIGVTSSSALNTCVVFDVFDLDGDGRLDLVVTADCHDATVGATRWVRYPGTATGFGAAVDFALPAPNDPGAWANASGIGALPGRLLAFDRPRRDVLLQNRDASGPHPTILRNVGTAFTAPGEPVAFPTAAYPAGSFDGYGNCALLPDGMYYDLVDVDGDGRQDLVIEQRCADATIGVSQWRVHRGIPGGFAATAQAMTLPAVVDLPWQLESVVLRHGGSAGVVDRFPALWGDCADPGAQRRIALLDVIGSPAPDLVVSASCGDPTVGTDHWMVFENVSACP